YSVVNDGSSYHLEASLMNESAQALDQLANNNQLGFADGEFSALINESLHDAIGKATAVDLKDRYKVMVDAVSGAHTVDGLRINASGVKISTGEVVDAPGGYYVVAKATGVINLDIPALTP